MTGWRPTTSAPAGRCVARFKLPERIERGAARCNEVLHYGGMGHTAGVHTRSREAAASFPNFLWEPHRSLPIFRGATGSSAAWAAMSATFGVKSTK
mgnify:CR=1 FL=1